MTRWDAVTRSALGFAALGAGLIHLALAVGAEPPLAVLLVAWGAGEMLWGVLAVSLSRPPMPQVAIGMALVPLAGWVVILATGFPDGPRPLPMLAATALDLAIAVGLAVAVRRTPTRAPRHPMAGIAIAAALVAALTVAAIGATEAPARLPGPPPPAHQH